MKLTPKVILTFLLLIVGPFLIVLRISFGQAAEITKRQVSEALGQLNKHNHTTLERTIDSLNDMTLRFIEYHFSARADFPIDLNTVPPFNQYVSYTELIAGYASDGTNYALVVPDAEGQRLYPADMRKRGGLIYVQPAELPAYYNDAVASRGRGILRSIAKADGGIVYARAILDPGNLEHAYGVLYVTRLEKMLLEDVRDTKLPAGGRIYFVNESGDVLASNEESAVGDRLEAQEEASADARSEAQEEAAGIAGGYRTQRVDGRDMVVVSTFMERYGTRLIYQVPVNSIIGQQKQLQNVLAAATIVYFLVVTGFLVFLLHSVLRPLSRLSRITRRYEPGMSFPRNRALERRDEIGQLHASFYQMVDRVNRFVEERYIVDLKHKEMELLALHTQVTPHLLYNTLDSIYWYAVDKEVYELAEMVKDLADLLRIGLSRGRELIAVRDEVLHIQAYIRLQLTRYRNVFRVHWDIDEDTLSYCVPKVILQPIAENAILHGIGKMAGEGELWIRAAKAAGRLVFLIEDNGFKPVDVEAINRMAAAGGDTGYGIRNVDRRIKLHFGSEYGIHYRQRESGGTLAEIMLPLVDSPDPPSSGSGGTGASRGEAGGGV